MCSRCASRLQAPLHRVQRTPPSRQTQCAFLGGLLGGGKIDDSKMYICTQCGYIYDGRQPFSEVPSDYKCPKCTATKRAFKAYKGARKMHNASLQHDCNGRPTLRCFCQLDCNAYTYAYTATRLLRTAASPITTLAQAALQTCPSQVGRRAAASRQNLQTFQHVLPHALVLALCSTLAPRLTLSAPCR